MVGMSCFVGDLGGTGLQWRGFSTKIHGAHWRYGALAWALKEDKTSSINERKGILSGALEWVWKEKVCRKKAARDEAPGMSGAWDWALKETPRATSAARWNNWGAACGIGPGAPKACASLGALGISLVPGERAFRMPSGVI